MAGYHKYVFDSERRRFVGRFDEMYRAEIHEGFDSWHQEDQRDLSKKIAFDLAEGYNFDTIIDIGCGKAGFTHLFKKKNNRVIGLDISPTALSAAQSRYPDIEFIEADLAQKRLSFFSPHQVDFALCLEILSYLPNWREVLKDISQTVRFALVALFIPQNPIGFVKDEEDLVKEFSIHFEILHDIRIRSMNKMILFGRTRQQGKKE